MLPCTLLQMSKNIDLALSDKVFTETVPFVPLGQRGGKKALTLIHGSINISSQTVNYALEIYSLSFMNDTNRVLSEKPHKMLLL